MKNPSMHFTIHKNCRIDELVQSHLSIISNRLTREFPNVVALILVGGFGRGEGGVIISQDNIRPVNDYDIVMIVENNTELQRLREIRQALAQKLNIWWVDISVYQKDKLRRLPFSMYVHDLKYGNYVFYGDKDITLLIPEMDSRKMPLVEVEIEFFTRMWCFLGPFSVEFLGRQLTSDEAFFLANQMSKALLTCSDAYLLLKGAYHHSYAERLERLTKLYPEKKDLHPLIKWATDFKLRPATQIELNLIDMYFNVKKVYLETMFFFVCQMYRKKFQNWFDYARAYYYNYKTAIRRIGYLLIRRDRRLERKLKINLAQLYLVAAYQRENIDEVLLTNAKKQVAQITKDDYSNYDWEMMRQLTADLRMKI